MPVWSRLAEIPAPSPQPPESCPMISVGSGLTSLCLWPPLCCQVLFRHITSGTELSPFAVPDAQIPQHPALSLVSPTHTPLLFFLSLSFQGSEYIIAAQVPRASSSSCSDLVKRYLSAFGLLQPNTMDGLAHQQQKFTPHSSGCKSNIKAPADSAYREDLLCGSETHFSPCPHLVEWVMGLSWVSYYEGTNPAHEVSTSHFLILSPWALGISTYEFGGVQTVRPWQALV